jgi:hypothetical protein
VAGVAAAPRGARDAGNGAWQHIVIGSARSACAGALWIAWPCALSQSDRLVAALASAAGQGALRGVVRLSGSLMRGVAVATGVAGAFQRRDTQCVCAC